MSATDWGMTFETHACEWLDLDHVAHDGREYENVDAVVTRAIEQVDHTPAIHPELTPAVDLQPGASIACKVARYRIRDGGSSRRGRYWIPRCEVAVVDAYAFGVYTVDDGVLDDAVAILDAETVADMVTSWVDSPRTDIDQVARMPWSRVFDPVEVIP